MQTGSWLKLAHYYFSPRQNTDVALVSLSEISFNLVEETRLFFKILLWFLLLPASTRRNKGIDWTDNITFFLLFWLETALLHWTSMRFRGVMARILQVRLLESSLLAVCREEWAVGLGCCGTWINITVAAVTANFTEDLKIFLWWSFGHERLTICRYACFVYDDLNGMFDLKRRLELCRECYGLPTSDEAVLWTIQSLKVLHSALFTSLQQLA